MGTTVVLDPSRPDISTYVDRLREAETNQHTVVFQEKTHIYIHKILACIIHYVRKYYKGMLNIHQYAAMAPRFDMQEGN